MYAKNDKRRLYELIDLYLSDIITTNSFCDEFYYSYNKEMNYGDLTKQELQCFSELDQVCNRFSPYEEDHKLDPRAFSRETDVRQKTIEIKYKLQLS